MTIKKVAALFLFLSAVFGVNSQTTKVLTTEIQGIVPTVFTLSTDMTDIETVDLVNANTAYLGKVIVYTNTKGIWTISINSKNAGKLSGKTPGNIDLYPYTMGFGTVDRIDLSSDFEMTYSTLVSKATVEYPVSISYTRLEDLAQPVVADTYSDIVTITVTIS